MWWLIDGADAETGKQVTVEVEAPDEQAARMVAQQRRILVASVSGPVIAGWQAIVPYAVVLLLAVLPWVSDSHALIVYITIAGESLGAAVFWLLAATWLVKMIRHRVYPISWGLVFSIAWATCFQVALVLGEPRAGQVSVRVFFVLLIVSLLCWQSVRKDNSDRADGPVRARLSWQRNTVIGAIAVLTVTLLLIATVSRRTM